MRKADIASLIHDRHGIPKREAVNVVELILEEIKESLAQGDEVKIAGFGNFTVRSKRERKGRNPKTGEEIGITPRRVVTFRASPVFKQSVLDATEVSR
ncbi:MAG: integration host factor subunit alpha [Nitrospirota bacterium]|nr:integration host factor subunit alpha [Nitrospirota bacterium]